ncbi:putative ascorbate-specific transmembrane electron transporter 1 [Senna tora]|uniref:ascorbate ferrireductase (transmembrane) n=1 Tax=Senna tora TaxID=362788 RepID=A0A834SRZ6_9FABA|nr:putative ascorbate-specific transmembrane electron transporter 1 [Senna tora]
MSGGYQLRATPITIFSHLLFIAITTLLLIWLLKFREGVAFNSSNNFKILNLHPLLMVIGFVLVGGEAIITYKAIPAKRRSVRVIHLVLHLIALASAILGIITIFKFKNEMSSPNLFSIHMFTLHSWLGIIAISSFGLQYILAFFAYFFPGAEMSTRASLMPWHRFIGIVIFLLGVCTAETGLVEYFQYLQLIHQQEALFINFTALLLFLYAVFVTLSVILPGYY